MAVCFYEGAIGAYGLKECDGALTDLWFGLKSLDDMKKGAASTACAGGVAEDFCETPLLREAKAQLDAYFAGRLKAFSLPLAPAGTLFQQKIWQLLCEIPYGKTCTYGEIAVRAGNPKASRAVGLANNRNPLPVFVPCHRVVGMNGSLTGYAGGLDVKLKLLQLEGAWLF